MKLNLTIDGNYLLNKDVFILKKEKTIYSDLPVYMRNEMTRLMKLFPFDNIIFTSDSRMRWRTQIYNDYKSTRKHDESIDWNEVYNIYDEFKAEISLNKRIKVYDIPYAEGDDLIGYILKESNKKGYSNIVIASDGDLHQLLNFDISKQYINIMYNLKFSDERTYLPRNYKLYLNEVEKNICNDLFNMNDDGELITFIKELIRKTKITEVSDEESLFIKLIKGDKKDCIPSIYIVNDRGIGDAGALTIYKKFKDIFTDEIDFDSDEFIKNAVSIVAMDKKITDAELIHNIENNMKLNRQLTTLDEKYLPIDLRDNIKKTVLLK